MAHVAIKIISNETRICIADPAEKTELPSRIEAVNFTELTITGIIIGSKSIGKSTSRNFVLSAIAENRVPTEMNPMVPRTMTNDNGNITWNML